MLTTSIITPVFNGSPYIQAHYQSVVKCLKCEFELIYIDNNSSDGSSKLIKKLMLHDSRVRLLFCQKQGASAARNVGLSNARGKVLCFLDIDDIFQGHVVNTQIALAGQKIPSQCLVKIDNLEEHLPLWKSEVDFNFYLNFGNQAPFSSFVTPRSNLRFDETIHTSEDWLFVVENRERFGTLRLLDIVGRRYNSMSGFSSHICKEDLLDTHVEAFGKFYGLNEIQSKNFLNRFYFHDRSNVVDINTVMKLGKKIFGLRNPKCLYRMMRLYLG